MIGHCILLFLGVKYRMERDSVVKHFVDYEFGSSISGEHASPRH